MGELPSLSFCPCRVVMRSLPCGKPQVGEFSEIVCLQGTEQVLSACSPPFAPAETRVAWRGLLSLGGEYATQFQGDS